ncbi:hypothetical protein M0Q97_07975 [Candidatus Dojkabacteria bacterium]|jgi:hypothetical protein|nr:hypothetical protein [Candidatus Dojkabacteria bacterium]
MPGKARHTKKWDRCIKAVKEKDPNINPYAICSSSIKDAGIKKQYQKKSGNEYYANRKKSESMITTFSDYIKEHYEEDTINRFQVQTDMYWSKVKELFNKYKKMNPKAIPVEKHVKQWLIDNDEDIIFLEPLIDILNDDWISNIMSK